MCPPNMTYDMWHHLVIQILPNCNGFVQDIFLNVLTKNVWHPKMYGNKIPPFVLFEIYRISYGKQCIDVDRNVSMLKAYLKLF